LTSITRNGAALTLVVSGVLGFWIGIRLFPTWHVAVESAQVVAGIVRYPDGNPFYIYHLKLWTVLHELLALLLRAGASEIALSRLLSGVLGMVSLQALSLSVFAVSRDATYALASALMIFLGGAAEFGGTYPIDLVGTTHTYGAIGLSSVVLTLGLLGSGMYRAGGLLLGFMPAIHPSLGIWTGTIAAAALMSDWKTFTREFRPAAPWFLLGGALTAISLAVHLWIARGIPSVPAEVAKRYFDTYVAIWDGHRRGPDLRDLSPYLHNPAVRITFGVVPIGIVWLRAYGSYLPCAARFFVRSAVAAACVAITVMVVLTISGGWLPSVIQMLMPTRVLNIVGMLCAPLLFGAIGAATRLPRAQWLSVPLAIGLVLGERSKLAIDRSRFPWVPDRLDPLTLIAASAIVLAIYAVYVRRHPAGEAPRAERTMLRATAAVSVLAVVVFWIPWTPSTDPLPLAFRDWRHDPVFSAAGSGRGLLATGDSLHLIQLKTRRPVLLDGGGIDGIVYAIDGAPAMDRIVRDVYGIDMFHPSAEEHTGVEAISFAVNQRNWQAYSREKWMQIRRAFDVTQVMTPATWQLNLPLVAADDELRLYDIPE